MAVLRGQPGIWFKLVHINILIDDFFFLQKEHNMKYIVFLLIGLMSSPLMSQSNHPYGIFESSASSSIVEGDWDTDVEVDWSISVALDDFTFDTDYAETTDAPIFDMDLASLIVTNLEGEKEVMGWDSFYDWTMPPSESDLVESIHTDTPALVPPGFDVVYDPRPYSISQRYILYRHRVTKTYKKKDTGSGIWYIHTQEGQWEYHGILLPGATQEDEDNLDQLLDDLNGS
jgi:hypothetical protein